MAIEFYTPRGEHGFLSNFSSHPFELDGQSWPTTEHYFQAMKFEGTKHADEVRNTSTPAKAAQAGRSRKRPLRSDWESVKEDVMRRALYAKFTTHDELREALLATGDERLIEASPTDAYWGWGRTKNGRNRLGVLLMELRDQLSEDVQNET